jgi:hypothetical protein
VNHHGQAGPIRAGGPDSWLKRARPAAVARRIARAGGGPAGHNDRKERLTMGDKGGKKDKEKSKQQQSKKQEQQAKDKQAKVRTQASSK